MSFSIDHTTWRSPNYGSRHGAPIKSIVVHSCEGKAPHPRSTSLPWLCNPASKVSAHYYVCRNADIFQLVSDANEAWHAGVCLSSFNNIWSLGIECEHRASQDWPSVQRAALAWLLQTIIPKYHILPSAIETHGQVALPGPYDRKHDPTDWSHRDFSFFADSLYMDAPPPAADRHYRVLPTATGGATIRDRPSTKGGVLGRLRAGQDWYGLPETGAPTYVKGFGSSDIWIASADRRFVWANLLEEVR